MTVERVNSILASLYEIMLCFSYLLEIMDEFQVPQQVKQSLVYTWDLSTMKSFQTATTANNLPKQQKYLCSWPELYYCFSQLISLL